MRRGWIKPEIKVSSSRSSRFWENMDYTIVQTSATEMSSLFHIQTMFPVPAFD